MLLRSSSTPVLNSWLPKDPNSSPEPEFLLQNQITPKSTSFSTISIDNIQIKTIWRNHSEADLREPLLSSSKRSFMNQRFVNFGMDCDFPVDDDDEDELVNEVSRIGLSVGGGGEGSCGGNGGSGGGRGDGDGCWDANHGTPNMDLYYRKMIEVFPENSMVLSNYGRYLKEFRGDLKRAEEYCGRAILVNPTDGDVLSLYADLIWESHEDANRAHIYFDRAIQAEPENSYIMASYARFLWDAENEFESEE